MKFPGIVLAVVAVTLAAPATSNAQANRPGFPTTNVQARSEQSHDDVCGVRTLRGTYTFAASGFNIVAGVAQPKAIVEVIEFNGDGTLSVPAATLSANGVIIRTVQWDRHLYRRGRLLGNHPLRRSGLRHLRFAGCRNDLDDPEQSKHRHAGDGDTDIARPRPALTSSSTVRSTSYRPAKD